MNSKKINTKGWSSEQFIAGREMLLKKSAELEKEMLSVMSPEAIPKRPVLKNGSAQEQLNHFEALADHVFNLCDVLKLNLDIDAILKGQTSSLVTVAQAAQPGATATASATGTGVQKAKFDPDAAILAARGVSSYADLHSKIETLLPLAQAAQPGAKASSAEAAPEAGTKKPAWNPDAKILEARGVATLDELNALGESKFVESK